MTADWLKRWSSGGDTVTGRRWKLEKSCCPREKFQERGRPYNRGHGKGAEGKQDGGLARSSEEGEHKIWGQVFTFGVDKLFRLFRIFIQYTIGKVCEMFVGGEFAQTVV